jgi:phospholipid/cholesterol/gamma-HCH transport system permease protein
MPAFGRPTHPAPPPGNALRSWFESWWRIAHAAALVLVLALSPSSYRRDNRRALAWQVYSSTAPNLLWFTLACALIGVVLIRIVVVTAVSYGLTRYALEMVVRVLVLEIIPLTAALFVALRCTIPDGAELSEMRLNGALDAQRRRGIDPVRRELLPRVAAGMFAVVTLAAMNCVVSLLIAYFTVYGPTLWALPGFTRTVGQVFDPALSAIFALKTVFFGAAVSLIPTVAGFYGAHGPRSRTSAELQGLVRMFVVILAVEVASLAGNYT